jgi:hypothetical protein
MASAKIPGWYRMESGIAAGNRKLSGKVCELISVFPALWGWQVVSLFFHERNTVSFLLAALGPNCMRAHPLMISFQKTS